MSSNFIKAVCAIVAAAGLPQPVAGQPASAWPAKLIRAEIAKWAPVVKAAGVQVD